MRPSYKRHENGGWVPVIRDGRRIVWQGRLCKNRDITTITSGVSASATADLVLKCLNGEGPGLLKDNRLGRQYLANSTGPGRSSGFAASQAWEEAIRYAMGESEKLKHLLKGEKNGSC